MTDTDSATEEAVHQCPKCGESMKLASILYYDDDIDICTYACVFCGWAEELQFKAR